MVNKKGDVSTTTIIMIAIGVFVLVLIIGFTTGVFGKMGKQIGGAGGGDIGQAKTTCKTLCSEAKTDLDGWKSASYCTQQQEVGDIDGDGSSDYAKCWEEPIIVICGDKKPVGTAGYLAYYVDDDGCLTTAEPVEKGEADDLVGGSDVSWVD